MPSVASAKSLASGFLANKIPSRLGIVVWRAPRVSKGALVHKVRSTSDSERDPSAFVETVKKNSIRKTEDLVGLASPIQVGEEYQEDLELSIDWPIPYEGWEESSVYLSLKSSSVKGVVPVESNQGETSSEYQFREQGDTTQENTTSAPTENRILEGLKGTKGDQGISGDSQPCTDLHMTFLSNEGFKVNADSLHDGEHKFPEDHEQLLDETWLESYDSVQQMQEHLGGSLCSDPSNKTQRIEEEWMCTYASTGYY